MISLYGITISLAMLTSILVVQKLAQKEEDFIWELSFWVIIGGIIGARLYHVLDYFSYYSEFPLQMFALWRGGLGIWGGIIGGFLTAYIFLKINNKDTNYWLDVGAVAMPLGQAIGRWGNFFNQEITGTLKTPLYVYESTLNFLLFIILYSLFKLNKTKTGTLVYVYLIAYSLIRLLLEDYRETSWEVNGLNVAKSISIIVILISVSKIIFERKKTK